MGWMIYSDVTLRTSSSKRTITVDNDCDTESSEWRWTINPESFIESKIVLVKILNGEN